MITSNIKVNINTGLDSKCYISSINDIKMNSNECIFEVPLKFIVKTEGDAVSDGLLYRHTKKVAIDPFEFDKGNILYYLENIGNNSSDVINYKFNINDIVEVISNDNQLDNAIKFTKFRNGKSNPKSVTNYVNSLFVGYIVKIDYLSDKIVVTLNDYRYYLKSVSIPAKVIIGYNGEKSQASIGALGYTERDRQRGYTYFDLMKILKNRRVSNDVKSKIVDKYCPSVYDVINNIDKAYKEQYKKDKDDKRYKVVSMSSVSQLGGVYNGVRNLVPLSQVNMVYGQEGEVNNVFKELKFTTFTMLRGTSFWNALELMKNNYGIELVVMKNFADELLDGKANAIFSSKFNCVVGVKPPKNIPIEGLLSDNPTGTNFPFIPGIFESEAVKEFRNTYKLSGAKHIAKNDLVLSIKAKGLFKVICKGVNSYGKVITGEYGTEGNDEYNFNYFYKGIVTKEELKKMAIDKYSQLSFNKFEGSIVVPTSLVQWINVYDLVEITDISNIREGQYLSLYVKDINTEIDSISGSLTEIKF